MAKFRVGDRVRHVQNGTARGGETGTIRGAARRPNIGWVYAVEFDRPIGRSTLLYYYGGGKSYQCAPGYGACCTEDCLEPAEILPGNIKLSFDDMFGGET